MSASKARPLSYRDALVILGLDDPSDAAGRFAGVAAAAVSIATVGGTDFFALRDELTSWGQQARSALRQRLAGSAYDRLDRIAAAHAVLVLTSYYDALGEVLGEAVEVAHRIEASTQLAIATGRPAAVEGAPELIAALLETPAPMPTPESPAERTVELLGAYYHDLNERVAAFLHGLAVADRHPAAVSRLTDVLGRRELVERAVRHYQNAFLRLTVDSPEFAGWAVAVDVRAVRHRLDLTEARLREAIGADRAVPPDPDAQLARVYRARLREPVLEPAEIRDRAIPPSLADLYVSPLGHVDHPLEGRFLAADRSRRGQPLVAADRWRGPPLVDVREYVSAFFEPGSDSPTLVVLGHPGAGKSALTRILAVDFVRRGWRPVQVELRSVRAVSDLQEQVEQAIYQTTGRRIGWPEFAEAAPERPTILLLDGLDELLLAADVPQRDFLERVRAFRLREERNGRLVRVLITSRITTVDDARLPAGTSVLRLQPFDPGQVEQWSAAWGRDNREHLAGRGLRPLPADVALRYPELAGYPLLLLMLALYDAVDNGLQVSDVALDITDLYQRVLGDFAEREVDRQESGLDRQHHRKAVRDELDRLGLVALGMHARGRQFVRGEDVDADLKAWPGVGGRPEGRADGGLTPGEALINRFFFVVESRAIGGDDEPVRTYEFLHATFGEFLLARLVVGLVAAGGIERIQAAFSFLPFTRSESTVGFIRALARQLPGRDRAGCLELVRRLLSGSWQLPFLTALPGYRPGAEDPVQRLAAYTANLAFLLTCFSEGPAVVPSTQMWRRWAGLWRSQLPAEDWQSLLRAVRITSRNDYEYLGGGQWSEVAQTRLHGGGDDPVMLADTLPWQGEPLIKDDEGQTLSVPQLDGAFASFGAPADSEPGQAMLEGAMLLDEDWMRLFVYSLSPYWTHVGRLTPIDGQETHTTFARALLELRLAPLGTSATTRAELFRFCLRHAHQVDASGHALQLVLRQLHEEADTLGPVATVRVLAGAVRLRALRDSHRQLITQLVERIAVDGPVSSHDREALRELRATVAGYDRFPDPEDTAR